MNEKKNDLVSRQKLRKRTLKTEFRNSHNFSPQLQVLVINFQIHEMQKMIPSKSVGLLILTILPCLTSTSGKFVSSYPFTNFFQKKTTYSISELLAQIVKQPLHFRFVTVFSSILLKLKSFF